MGIRSFGENLVELRTKRNMTQSELANQAGVTKQAISKYEHGNTVPNVNTAAAIAIALETTIDVLASTEDKRLWCKFLSSESEEENSLKNE